MKQIKKCWNFHGEIEAHMWMVTEYVKENIEQNNVQLKFSTERLSSAPRTKYSTEFMFHMYGNACRHKV